MADPQQLLTPELTLTEAARLLGVDRRTVKALIEGGFLRARMAGRPRSLKPRYRLPKDDVLQLRNSYSVGLPQQTITHNRKTTKRSCSCDLKHIRLKD